MKLQGKVAIITGAARGIGRAFAERLAEEGASIVVADVLDGQDTAKAIESRGGQALALRVDVSKAEDTEAAVKSTIERFGRIDVLVNNAGLFANLTRGSFADIPLAEWDLTMSVNLRGLFLCSRAVYPYMKDQGEGSIINISSGTALKGTPNMLHYVTSKGGVISFTRALAKEIGESGIRVNSIAPGITRSEGMLNWGEDADAGTVASRVFKRSMVPDDLTGALVFLASDDSRMMTGQLLVVDGGAVFH
jgi:NAD(P)-dependent dehydrogenase (short-subunit alcohol dehydrogenase family)